MYVRVPPRQGNAADEGHPDPFRVAVVCLLHEKLLRLFGRYEGVMSVLHREMLRAIFPPPEKKKEDGEHKETARGSGWEKAQRIVERPPYFVQAARVARKNDQLRAQIEIYTHKEDFIAREKVQREFAIKFTVNTWRWKCMAHLWDKWKLVTELTRTVLNTARSRFAERRLMRRFSAWRQWQLRCHVRRYKLFVEIIKPDHNVHDFPLEDPDDPVELDKYGRPKQPPTLLEKVTAFRQQDKGYQELMGEKEEVELSVKKIEQDTVSFAAELFACKPLIEQHLTEAEREQIFTRWSMLSSNAHFGTEHKELGKAVRDIRTSSNSAAEEARERSEKLGLLAAKTYGRRLVKTFRTAEEARRDAAAVNLQRAMRGWRSRSRYQVEIREHRKMLETAKTSGLVGPSSEHVQHLLFKLDFLDKEISLLRSKLQLCPGVEVLGDVRTQEPVDTLFAWVNYQLGCRGSTRRLQEWTVDLHDSEIFAALIDQLSMPEVFGAVATPISLLFTATSGKGKAANNADGGGGGAPPPPSPMGRPSMLKKIKEKTAQADRAALIAIHLAQWKDGHGNPGGVVLRPAHVFGQDGPIGDKAKLQFALARMFLLRAALPPVARTAVWIRCFEQLQLSLTQLRAQVEGIRGQRRGWCSVGAITRLSQVAQELEAELDVERKAAAEQQRLWQHAERQMDLFAQGLAMRKPSTSQLLEEAPAGSSAGEGEGAAGGGLDTPPSDGSVCGVHLHSKVREGMLRISEELWGTAAEQHDRELGRVASWVWSSQCMLFQVFRFYVSRSNLGAGAMGEDDWRRFVDDCQLPLPPGAAQQDKDKDKEKEQAQAQGQGPHKELARAVFEHFKPQEGAKPGRNRTTNPAEDYALTFFEFTLAVIELAGRVAAAEISSASDMLLSVRVSRFLERHVARYVPRSDSAALGVSINTDLVRDFFSGEGEGEGGRRKELKSVFTLFSKADEGALNSLDTMNQREFGEQASSLCLSLSLALQLQLQLQSIAVHARHRVDSSPPPPVICKWRWH
eukprot:COSAG06_NODE_1173_length_10423_cov_4.361100_3_plen_1019_part_00